MTRPRCTIRQPAARAARPICAATFTLLLAVMTAACGSGNDPVAQSWLHGAWELTFNPDRDSDDELIFDQNGLVRVLTESERILEGNYQVVDDTLMMVLIVNDNPVEVRFDISPDKTRLIYENGAYYMKKAATAAHSVMPQIAE